MYYCSNNTFLPDSDVIHSLTLCMTAETTTVDTPHQPRSYHPGQPTTCGQQLLSELWTLRLGHYNARQLEHIPDHANNTPSFFSPHPFHFVDVKEQGRIQRQPIGCSPDKAQHPRLHLFMDFGFIRVSTSDCCHPCPGVDWVVECFEFQVVSDHCQ